MRRVGKICGVSVRVLTIEGMKRLEPCLEQHDLSVCDDPGLALETYQARLAVLD